MTITKNLSTPESREFWIDAAKASETVAGWPNWKKGELMPANYLPSARRDPAGWRPVVSDRKSGLSLWEGPPCLDAGHALERAKRFAEMAERIDWAAILLFD